MKKFTQLILMVLILIGFNQAVAQTTVSGKVTDENSEALTGVTVIIKGTLDGTTTDIDGNYSLTVPDPNAVLIFSYVGFAHQEVALGGQSSINVSLKPDLAQLDEVVVVGYGTQRKRDITGAVTIVDVEELGQSNHTSVTDRLQGRAPGVQVTNTGEPGVRGNISIRGTSFLGNNNPLFVIDGILTDDNPNLNPNDIESIQVLKDASSAAIYGSRAANGVVVITTKKGKIGAPQISLSSSIGIQQVPKKFDMMNASQWAAVRNAASDISGADRQEHANNLPGIDTDWQAEVFDDAAIFRDHNVSISAGTEKSRIYFSLNNTFQDGTIEGPEFERLGTRLNTEYELFKGLKIGQNLTVSRAVTSGEQIIDEIGVDGGVITTAISMLPVIPVFDDTKTNGYGHGVPGVATTFTENPVGVRDLSSNRNESTRILGNIYLDWEIIEGLNYRFSGGIDGFFNREMANWVGGQIRMTTVHRAGLIEQRGESRETFLENRLTYTKTFGNHSLAAMATYTEQDFKSAFQRTRITGGFDGPDPFFQISATTAPSNSIQSSGTEDLATIRSILGRLSYSFADKYLLTINVRRDGNSKFSDGNRWGTFPSISAGWNISNESFFNVPAISYLKLRAGYGEVGNASIANFAYQQLIRTASVGGVNYNFGPSSTSTIGATAGDIVNRDIRWEVLKETNIGIDLAMFDGQLEVIADYYFGDLEDLLTGVPIPASAGFSGSPTINAVSMERNGWELGITYKKLTGDFKYSITANAFSTDNKVTALPFGVSEFLNSNSVSRIGIPLGQLFMPIYEGIYTSQAEIDALGPDFTISGARPKVGDAKYQDTNGRDPETGELTGRPDGKISFDDDRAIVGNPIPDVQYGLNFSAQYKDFDATVFFQGVAGRDVYNTYFAQLKTGVNDNFLVGYDPHNLTGSGTEPNVEDGGFENGNGWASTRFVENGGYLRLKNLQIGYTVPWEKVSNLRFYVSGQNLFTITDFEGLDPEFVGNLDPDADERGNVFAPGIDPQGFPNVRIFTAGFNLTF